MLAKLAPYFSFVKIPEEARVGGNIRVARYNQLEGCFKSVDLIMVFCGQLGAVLIFVLFLGACGLDNAD